MFNCWDVTGLVSIIQYPLNVFHFRWGLVQFGFGSGVEGDEHEHEHKPEREEPGRWGRNGPVDMLGLLQQRSQAFATMSV